ncbi:MAG: hypothetical protein IPL53_07350 [Ignavibacteria bacterium]|nr:hypothetical protein [Ignavibacteria bacterium]
MSANKSASLEARLKNNKDLVTSLKQLSKYAPTSEDIKSDKYDEFIELVETQMIPYKNSNAELTTAQSGNLSVINNMTEISRSVRSEIAEIKSDQSAEYANVNSIVKMITGQNISEHTKNVRKVRKSLKEGESAPDPISVAQLDFKSRLGNFKSLIALLRTYDFYHPSDAQLSIDALKQKPPKYQLHF